MQCKHPLELSKALRTGQAQERWGESSEHAIEGADKVWDWYHQALEWMGATNRAWLGCSRRQRAQMHLVEMVGVSQDGNNGTRDDNGDRMVLGLARDVLHLPAFVDDESTTGGHDVVL